MSDREIDWASVRGFLRKSLQRHISGAPEMDAEDLVQESSIRLLRAVRRGPIENLEALMNDIAHKTVIDARRRSRRWQAMRAKLTAETASEGEALTPWPGDLGDPFERVRFVVLAFFERRSPGCHELALHYFRERREWAKVAAFQGRTHTAVRRQWSRCVALLRKHARQSPDFLSEWSRDEADPDETS